jgi:hypothetical protein
VCGTMTRKRQPARAALRTSIGRGYRKCASPMFSESSGFTRGTIDGFTRRLRQSSAERNPKLLATWHLGCGYRILVRGKRRTAICKT